MKAVINEKDTVIFEPLDDNPLKGNDFHIDILEVNGDAVRFSYNGRNFDARLLKYDLEKKEAVLKLDGNRFHIKLTDEYDELLKSLNIGTGATKKINNLKAPMPGVVFDIKVSEGDTISEGDALIILEAMKMENILKSPVDATIKSVSVKQGETVEKNKILIEFE